MDSVMRIDGDLLELEINNEDQRELGPLKYLVRDNRHTLWAQVVNWSLLLIIICI